MRRKGEVQPSSVSFVMPSTSSASRSMRLEEDVRCPSHRYGPDRRSHAPSAIHRAPLQSQKRRPVINCSWSFVNLIATDLEEAYFAGASKP